MIEIKHKHTGDVLYRCESAETVREAMVKAVRDGANLTWANLSDANLSDANLAGANLADANLADADLSWANLAGADLSRAILNGAILNGADLTWSNLTRAILTEASLTMADLTGADLTGVAIDHRIPRVPLLHRRILAALESGGALEMKTWHTCETTHCRAGWAIHLAGEAGYALEFGMSSPTAGALIHIASCPQLGRVPDFYASNEDALADIRRLAAMEQ